ncbi:chemotaxis protein histidine kinase-like protein [Mizugakiibacter sediminis]|uniref:Chemotaxis protein CheA n=1 Tax=Mizugakiibacter sediminis TaxID=1475481 RepID=A0A0K8QMQ6_9GAMM|nr:chemotaxis protein CheA [Mizugakiibacter sediminis]GAP66180.1 chemotaxis protein histidine kinase-like protein [Mizugakiibacter sediminis]
MAKVDLSQFHQTFFDESLEGLDAMEAALLKLDPAGVDAELVNTIFRAAHSIKGGSATFGFADVAAFTHVAEELLEELRAGKRAATPELVELMLRSVDCLRGMLDRARRGAPSADADSDAVLGALRALARGDVRAADEAADAAVPPAVPVAAAPAVAGWEILFRPYEHLLKSGNDPVRMFRELARLGPLQARADTARLPLLAEIDPEACYLAWDLRLEAAVPRAAVEAVFEWVDGDCELRVTPIEAPAAAASMADAPVAAPAPPAAAAIAPVPVAAAPVPAAAVPPAPARAPARSEAHGGDTGSIRVAIEKVDALINMVGELVITQSMLGQLGERFEPSMLEALRAGLAQLERNTRELQESVMRIRMLPISTVFNRFPRLVHDLERKLGKQVHLELHGEQTELDKTVLEKIGDPLVHLVRNAIDHGLESPERRRAAGKPEAGTLRLNAYHLGGNIVVEVSDDGAGLDREAIVRKARERGLIGAADQPDDAAVAELIFQPGFSTAAATTDLSGRGVGMDVVRRNVNDLGGTVAVASRPGQGSTFTITLPLTLAIIDGLTAQVGDEHYIIPLVSIIESMQLRREQINRIGGEGEVFRFREGYLPIVRLHALFGCRNAVTDATQGIVVVVEGEGRRVGLLVDALLGQQQAVIKSLEAHYRRVGGISGATVTGDGSVALIVDVPGVVRLAHARTRAAA